MAKRVGIGVNERDQMVAVLKQTKDWEQAVAHIGDIDRKLLDDGFKVWAHQKAGVPLPEVPKAKPDPLK
jgi:hypothetical protein